MSSGDEDSKDQQVCQTSTWLHFSLLTGGTTTHYSHHKGDTKRRHICPIVTPCHSRIASAQPSEPQPSSSSSARSQSGLMSRLRRGVGMGAGDCRSCHCRLDDAAGKRAQFAVRDTIGTLSALGLDII